MDLSNYKIKVLQGIAEIISKDTKNIGGMMIVPGREAREQFNQLKKSFPELFAEAPDGIYDGGEFDIFYQCYENRKEEWINANEYDLDNFTDFESYKNNYHPRSCRLFLRLRQPIAQPAVIGRIETIGDLLTENNFKVVFGIQPEHIKLIHEYAAKYGGYNHHVFKDVAKIVSWDALTLACYFFEWQQSDSVKKAEELEALLAIHEKRNGIINYLFDIDWMGTKEFCETYSLPVPVALPDVKEAAQQFIFVDCMRWKKTIEKAKEIARANPLPKPASI